MRTLLRFCFIRTLLIVYKDTVKVLLTFQDSELFRFALTVSSSAHLAHRHLHYFVKRNRLSATCKIYSEQGRDVMLLPYMAKR